MKGVGAHDRAFECGGCCTQQGTPECGPHCGSTVKGKLRLLWGVYLASLSVSRALERLCDVGAPLSASPPYLM